MTVILRKRWHVSPDLWSSEHSAHTRLVHDEHKVHAQHFGPKGGLFPEAPPGESQPAKEFAGLSVWQPHTKVTTQRGKRVLSL